MRKDEKGEKTLGMEEEESLERRKKKVEKKAEKEVKPVEKVSAEEREKKRREMEEKEKELKRKLAKEEEKPKAKPERGESEVERLLRGEYTGGVSPYREPERSRTVLAGLNNLKKQLDVQDPTHKVTEYLGETIIDLRKAFSEYESEIDKAGTEDEKTLALAKLLRKTTEELQLLADQVKPSKIPFLEAIGDLMTPSVDKMVRSHLQNQVTEKYFDMLKSDERNLFKSNLPEGFGFLAMKARIAEGQIYEKINPVAGYIVMTGYIRKSHLGDENKGEVKPAYFYTGEVEPQFDAEDMTLSYVMTAVGGGLLESYSTMGPLPYVAQPLVFNWSLADYGKTANIGLNKAGHIPTQEQMVVSLEDAKKAREKNCGYIFVGPIKGTQIKEVYVVDDDKKMKSSFWDEKNQKDLEAFKGRWLSDPYQIVYVVAPADNSRLDKEDVNQRKIAFYDFDAAKRFAELAKKHPYWYDSEKGWNLKGWEEKMERRDFAVMAVEDILRTYLTPGIFTDFESYYSSIEPFEQLPIYEELEELNKLVNRLQTGRREGESEEEQARVFQDISETFEKIEKSLKDKELPNESYGLATGLSKAFTYIKDKFEFKPPREEQVMKM